VLKRNLIIGLGGSAEKLVRFLHRDVERRLRDTGWPAGSIAAWRWLCIDVARDSDPVSDAVPAELGGERLGLADDPGFAYSAYYRHLTIRPETLPALLGSVPGPGVQLPPPYWGAGQRPQIGSAVGYAELKRIAAAIDVEVAELMSQEAKDELLEVARAMKVRSFSAEPATNVFVVSSLCGGSGAGLLQVVIELLRGTATSGREWKDTELSTLLFTPDVFADLTDRQRQGVYANALHTVSTLINGYEAEGSAPPPLMQILRDGGVTRLEGRRAAATNFFIGAGNGKIEYRHQDEVFEATAKALARIVADERVSAALDSHQSTNADGAPATAAFRISDAIDTSRPASSLGYASIAVDGRVLSEYVVERLARAQISQLRAGHRAYAATPHERDDETIAALVAAELPPFLAAAGLAREVLLSDLYDDAALIDRFEARHDAIRVQIASGVRTADPADWEAVLRNHFASVEPDAAAEHANERAAHAVAWRARANAALPAAVAHSMGKFGIRTTLALIDAARTHARELAGALDVERREQLLPQVGAGVEHARNALRRGDRRGIRRDDVTVLALCRAHAQALLDSERAAYREVAAGLLHELEAALLMPLRRAVERADAELARSEERDRETIEGWATRAVPPRLRPARNELVLEPIATIPERVETLLQRTLGASDGTGAGSGAPSWERSEREAAREMLVGVWPAPGGAALESPQTLIVTDNDWNADGGATSIASFHVRLDAHELLRRARAWTETRDGALRDRLRLSIAGWIAQSPPGADERFADRFESALSCAAPLARVNGDVHELVHGGRPDPATVYVNALPIAAGNHVGDRLERALRKAGVPDGATAKLFDATSPARTVEISRFMAQPVLPVVLDGMFVPIHQDWQRRTDARKRAQFSVFRRTRPLPLFVPLSPARQEDFVVGWMVAGLLGQLSQFTGSWDARPLTVWTPKGRRPFPPNLLGVDVEDADEVLPRVLLSLPLALASYAAKVPDELEAYMRILDLSDLRAMHAWIDGAAPETAGPGVDPAPTPPLATTVPANAPDPAEARRAALFRSVHDQGASWQTAIERHQIAAESLPELPLLCELEALLRSASTRLEKVLMRPKSDPDLDPDPEQVNPPS
jgi:Tubulin like